MATFYTAKFNINERIYHAAKGEVTIGELLEKVFNGLNQETKVTDIKDEDITYKFVDLHRDYNKNILDGTIVKYYDGINSRYNEEEDKVIDEQTKNKAEYVSFSFDIKKEIIGFVPKMGFSKEVFIKYFEMLVSKSVPEVGNVVLILVIDAAELDAKFNKMSLLKELQVNIIPENDDKADIADIIEILRDDIKGSNAQHIGINLKGTIKEPLVKKSNLVQSLKGVAKKAYARLIAVGRDNNGSKYTIDSQKDTLLTRTIRDDNRNSLPLISELTQETANVYIEQKAREVNKDGKER